MLMRMQNNQKSHTLLEGVQNGTITSESCCFFIKLNMHLSCHPTIPHLMFPFVSSKYQYPQRRTQEYAEQPYSKLPHTHRKGTRCFTGLCPVPWSQQWRLTWCLD